MKRKTKWNLKRRKALKAVTGSALLRVLANRAAVGRRVSRIKPPSNPFPLLDNSLHAVS